MGEVLTRSYNHWRESLGLFTVCSTSYFTNVVTILDFSSIGTKDSLLVDRDRLDFEMTDFALQAQPLNIDCIGIGCGRVATFCTSDGGSFEPNSFRQQITPPR